MTIILGSLDKLSCVAYYARQSMSFPPSPNLTDPLGARSRAGSNSIVSIAQFENPKDDDGSPLLVHCKELMRRGRMLTLEDVRARKVSRLAEPLPLQPRAVSQV